MNNYYFRHTQIQLECLALTYKTLLYTRVLIHEKELKGIIVVTQVPSIYSNEQQILVSTQFFSSIYS